ncbi:MAG: hemolysin family protein [Planctomycetota bacterium]
MLGLLTLTILIILICSFCCSLIEAAFLSVSPAKIEVAIDEHRFGANFLKSLKDSPSRPIAAIVIMNNICNITGSMTVGVIVQKSTLNEYLASISALLTILIILFSEILPKNIGYRYPLKISLFFAPVLWLLPKILLPMLLISEMITSFIRPESSKHITDAEIEAMVELGKIAGSLDQEKAERLRNIFELYQISVEEAMTPRVKLFALPANSVLNDIMETLLNTPYSRIPIYQEDKDKITGVILRTDALAALCKGEGHKTLEDIHLPVPQVPTTMPLDKLLKEFMASRTHLAVVRDEFGGTDGIITLEDVVEEILGNIDDEYDPDEEKFHQVSEYEVIVNGDIELDEINSHLKIELEDIARTIAGFIQERLHIIPEKGEVLEEPEATIIIEESTETQILKVRIIKKQTAVSVNASAIPNETVLPPSV